MKTKITATLLTLAFVVGVGFQAAAADGPAKFSVMKNVPLAEPMTVEQLDGVVGSGVYDDIRWESIDLLGSVTPSGPPALIFYEARLLDTG